MGVVYLIHFAEMHFHTQHYIGFCESDRTIEKRMQYHRSGNGAKIMKAVTEAGIEWHIVRLFENVDRTFERELKKHKKARDFCPLCNVAAYADKPSKHTFETIEAAGGLLWNSTKFFSPQIPITSIRLS